MAIYSAARVGLTAWKVEGSRVALKQRETESDTWADHGNPDMVYKQLQRKIKADEENGFEEDGEMR